MKKSPLNHKLAIIVIEIVATIMLLFFTVGCGDSVLDKKTSALNRSLPDETSNNVSIYAYQGDKVDYIITASKMERFYDSRQLNAWNVKIVTYDDEKNITGTILADTTYVDEARNFIKAIGNVIYQSPNGTIKSHLINWDRNTDEIYTPEKVVLIRDDKILMGNNLRTNSAISYAEMDTVSASGTIEGNEIDWK